MGGLANGTYFWRVQAVNGAFVQGAWSNPMAFTVTGAAAGAVGTPLLQPTKAYSTFHPYETETFSWSAVPSAVSYLLQASTNPSFDVSTRIQFDNIPGLPVSSRCSPRHFSRCRSRRARSAGARSQEASSC